jgi:hypothetical protein
VKRTRAARDALHNEAGVFINQNGHRLGKQEKRKKSGSHELMKRISRIPAFLLF